MHWRFTRRRFAICDLRRAAQRFLSEAGGPGFAHGVRPVARDGRNAAILGIRERVPMAISCSAARIPALGDIWCSSHHIITFRPLQTTTIDTEYEWKHALWCEISIVWVAGGNGMGFLNGCFCTGCRRRGSGLQEPESASG